MSRTTSVLKLSRSFHLYSGVFLAPALLFFAITGFVQTFSLHETTRGSSYKPPALLVELGQLHKKQTLVVPAHKNRPDAPTPAKAAPDTPPTPPPAPEKVHNLWPMKIFFAIVSVGLVFSTLSGLFMSYSYVRNKTRISLALLAGVVVPLLLLLF
jgi:hypothetical protein